MRAIFILVFIAISVIVFAQGEIPELITDRPDQTESSAVVPHKFLQIETGFVMENDKTDLIKLKSFTYNTTLLRYGLLENFEIRLGLEYLAEKVQILNTEITNSFSGLSPLYAGFKVKVADEEGLRPEVAFLGGLVLPFTANKDFKPQYTAADFRFAFSHTLSDRFSLGYNLGAEWDGETAAPKYLYSVALGMGLMDNLGVYVESFGSIPGIGVSEHLFDVGFTYLLLPNLQLDVSGGVGLNNASIENYVGIGLSYCFLHNK